MIAPTFVRVALAVTADANPAGVVVFDSRSVNAAACRCGAAIYDMPALAGAVCWLVGHLTSEHGVERLRLDGGGGPETGIARQVRAALQASPGQWSAA